MDGRIVKRQLVDRVSERTDRDRTQFVRALDEGGLAWEGNDQYGSLDDALRALDAAIAEWKASG